MHPDPSPSQSGPWWRGITGYQWLVLFVAWLGWTFDVMDALLWTFVKTDATSELLRLPASDPKVALWAGGIQAALLIGWATGGILFGVVSDKIGRTKAMLYTILIYSLFTGLSCFVQNIEQLAVCRFLTGLGVGGEWACGAALIAEVFPGRARTWVACILQSAASVGIILANTICSSLKDHGYGWREAFAVGIAPALLTVLLRYAVKEPDTWKQAHASHSAQESGSLRELFSPRFRRHTGVGVALATAGVFGIWGANYCAVDLLNQVAKAEKVAISNWQTLAQMAGFLFCAPIAVYLGRRHSFAFYFLGSLVVTPLCFHLSVDAESAKIWVPLMGFFTGGMFSGYIIYLPELYPSRLRATGAGFCLNVARYAAAAGPWLMGWMQGKIALKWAATLIALIYLLGLAALPFARETKDQPLPED
ncbi:MAG: hypothetical protein RL095_1696 [Verrucomicrobiota bacterium]|jgi:MFS family permease